MSKLLDKLTGLENYQAFNQKLILDLTNFLSITDATEELEYYAQLVTKYDLLPVMPREGTSDPKMDSGVKLMRLQSELNDLDMRAEVALYKVKSEDEYTRLIITKLLAKVYHKVLNTITTKNNGNKSKAKPKKK